MICQSSRFCTVVQKMRSAHQKCMHPELPMIDAGTIVFHTDTAVLLQIWIFFCTDRLCAPPPPPPPRQRIDMHC